MTQRSAQRGLRWQGLFKSLCTEGEGVSGQPPPLQTSPPPLAKPMIQPRSEPLAFFQSIAKGQPTRTDRSSAPPACSPGLDPSSCPDGKRHHSSRISLSMFVIGIPSTSCSTKALAAISFCEGEAHQNQSRFCPPRVQPWP